MDRKVIGRLKSDEWYEAENAFVRKLMQQYEVSEGDAMDIHEFLLEKDPTEFLTHLFKTQNKVQKHD